MESVHGVDVSWMSNHIPKDNRPHVSRASTSPPEKTKFIHNGNGNGNVNSPAEQPTGPKPIPIRPTYSRSASSEKTTTLNNSLPKSLSPSPSRRNSWLSSISSKFSSSPVGQMHAPPTASPPSSIPESDEPLVPVGPSAPKNAILPHAVKQAGDVPYTPAPPKSTQSNFLQSALRRLSNSGGQLQASNRGLNNGICERRVLNVDKNRERCHISDLDQTKLRRVAFCVDVEIASGPRYLDEKEKVPEGEEKDTKKEKKRVVEKGEAEALKNPDMVKNDRESDGVVTAVGEGAGEILPANGKDGLVTTTTESEAPSGDTSKKKEKKKRSEEERKARKEKKRKLAEANGTLPVELVRNASDSSGPASPTTTRSQASPTTDPVRIYRRCCQLRETPILKRITEQLVNPAGRQVVSGVVSQLDLTGYWLQLPDLITLGDYLAVVPVKEVIMENCGLTDEGVRVILAGLLAAKCPDWERKMHKKGKWGEVPQGGFVERVVFKNNSKIGRDGWRYISTFIAMCRSLKSMDLSKVPFPQPASTPASPSAPHSHLHLTRTTSSTTSSLASNPDVSCILGKAIGERLGGREFELINLAECGMSTEQLGSIVDGVIKSGLRRLGIAGNKITPAGMEHVARYIREGKCEGLDLGGNDLKDDLSVIAKALDESNPLYALSLADCNLIPDSLWSLFPALAKLGNFRFIDLSQNHGLYLPRIPTLKRIHLTDVSMTPEQAIALAEILPESPNLAHVNIMENPLLAALAHAKGEANQEEACALYASLMAAVRVSQTIICIDIEVPSPDSSEVVKALAKQVVAYCLWNMEQGPVAEISEAAAAISEPHGGEKEVAVPDVLLHLVGHVEGMHTHDEDEPAPDDDYVIGGTGVVKALGICLRNRGNDSRRASVDHIAPGRDLADGGCSGTVTPRGGHIVRKGGKAKDMSKNLLQSARKIRARLQPALVKESRAVDQNNFRRLQFLDHTLEGMIKRFEDEYPETRLHPGTPEQSHAGDTPSPTELEQALSLTLQDSHTSDLDPTRFSENEADPVPASENEDDDRLSSSFKEERPIISRHNSDVSIFSRALAQEEGRMHRFGQQFRREILKPESADHIHGTTGLEDQPRHLQLLRAMLECLDGDEIKNRINRQGTESLLEDLKDEASVLREELIRQDPEGWEKFRESQKAAVRNGKLEGLERNGSAIE
ncbi:related to GIP3 Glc7-interacting protein whose overexpression relocalizes Glc7p from the nucleus [Rhynchosporium graminicola]|uniref:Related to GIP3 Glc7-interacting protein whose overexpression relocalizes Glc7p from the nucleus n=1 Tax=Rhynchosporium graminicola TaxID=2792576 RepID=A0A1E1JVI3_9HELO|nr:related to GIP3 Glc7-interacting protein whose overexpression relocalizes Glc7p from the nucleus [Rhynchosporium commune]